MWLNKFLPFLLPVVFCAISQSIEESALQIFSSQRGFTSKDGFSIITSFISKVKQIDPEEIVTKEDLNLLREIGFDALIFIAFPSLTFGQDGNKPLQWKAIFDACLSYQIGMPFDRILSLIYCFESVDSLDREQFLNFSQLLDFFQGGKMAESIEKMKFLLDILGTRTYLKRIVSGVFQNQESCPISNSELIVLSGNACFTSNSIGLDFQRFDCIPAKRLCYLIKRIFDYYTKRHHKSSGVHLESIRIKNMPQNKALDSSLNRLLRKKAKSLTSLKILGRLGTPNSRIRFTNLRDVSFSRLTFQDFCAYEFVHHSNYKSLFFDFGLVNDFDSNGNSVFRINYGPTRIAHFISILNHNPHLEHLKVPMWYEISGQEEEFKSAMRTLTQLKTLYFYCPLMNIEECINPDNSIETLAFLSAHSPSNWISFGEIFKELNFLYFDCQALPQNRFLDFLLRSKLKLLFLGMLQLSNEESLRFYNVINQMTTLQKLIIRMYDYSIVQGPYLSERFEAISVEIIVPLAGKSIFENLPTGSGIKFFLIKDIGTIQLTIQDFQILKQKFPSIQYFYYIKGEVSFKDKWEIHVEKVKVGGIEEISKTNSAPQVEFVWYN